MSELRSRRSIRLQDYDYSMPGAYFVTICTHNRRPILRRERFAAIVTSAWHELAMHFPAIVLDEIVIMPDHVHFIVMFGGDLVGAGLDRPVQGAPRRAPTLADAVRAFKGDATREINRLRRTPGSPVWQRNYYEHIVRNERESENIREYIHNNALGSHSHEEDNLALAWEEPSGRLKSRPERAGHRR